MNRVVRLLAAIFCAAPAVTPTTTHAADVPLVNHAETWRWHKGNSAPQSNWKTVADSGLDATWLSSAGGFGYADNANETNQCRTVLSDMRNSYTTFYVRRQFTVASEADAALHLMLTMDFDDGFMAWLDGNFLTNALVSGAPTEPASNATASGSHESSRGSNPANPPATYDLGPIGSRLAAGTHTLAILGLNQSSSSSDFILIADLALAEPAVPGTNIWTLANSPIQVPNTVTITPGSTLIIEPGVTVQMGSAANLVIADGAVLLAEGTASAPIHFTRAGTSGNWGHITIDGSPGSPESRIAHATFEFNANSTGTPCIDVSGGTADLDHLTFANTGAPYIHVDAASFVISYCHFPTATASFELVHGVSGIKSGGHGIFYRNYFGSPQGYNDTVDFTGGNRPGPITHFIENVFNGSSDDCLDLDSTDAWVEGNIFLHVHRNGAPDSSSGVSGGSDNASNSEITIVRNIFYDCDQAAMGKQTNFYTLINNTIVHQTHVGGEDPIGAVVNLSDPGFSEGRGMYLENNIVFDAEGLTRGVTDAIITYTNNLLPEALSWTGPGGNNFAGDPLFVHVPEMSETAFANWAEAQVLWEWLSLRPGSPAIGASTTGGDLGAVIAAGAMISGAPAGTTPETSASLHVAFNRTGHGIPTSGWPNGSGYLAYKWRVDGGAWSAETSLATPIELSTLANGSHVVEVSGKRDSGLYQDDPLFGDVAAVSRVSWTVGTSSPPAITNPVRIGNTLAFTFIAQAGQTYSVLSRDALDPAHPWVRLTNIPAQPATGPYNFTDPQAISSQRFYQIVTPAVP